MRLRWLPNALSVARVPASLGLIAVYDPHPGLRLWIAFFLVGAIFISDALDGKIARRYATQSKCGYILDGWADRAFHIATYLILFDQGLFGICFVWVLVFREVTVYAVRACDSTWHSTQATAERMLSKSYTAIIRLILVFEVLRAATQWKVQVQLYSQVVIAVLCVWNLISYMNLSRRFVMCWRRMA
jgi:phosphatidylglycerophosphate synthase